MIRRMFGKWGFALFFGAVIALIAAEASEAAVGWNIEGSKAGRQAITAFG